MTTERPGIVEGLERIRGRALTTEEANRILGMQRLLNIQDNDALWTVLLALEHYQQLYEDMPPRIEAAGHVAVAAIKETADAVAAAAAESAKQELAGELAESVRDIANQTARKQQWHWITAGLIAASVCTVSAGCLGFARGKETGVAIGYAAAHSEATAAAWGASPDGRLAYRLTEVGSLQQLAHCSMPGWVMSNGVCFAKPAEDGTLYGWRLP